MWKNPLPTIFFSGNKSTKSCVFVGLSDVSQVEMNTLLSKPALLKTCFHAPKLQLSLMKYVGILECLHSAEHKAHCFRLNVSLQVASSACLSWIQTTKGMFDGNWDVLMLCAGAIFIWQGRFDPEQFPEISKQSKPDITGDLAHFCRLQYPNQPLNSADHTFWEINVFAFLQRVRREERYQSHNYN